MKINKYSNHYGFITEIIDGSNQDKVLYKGIFKLIHTYEIPENKEHSHFSHNARMLCEKCNSKPIINPHMKPKRPSYGEAKEIISKFHVDSDYTHSECLRDLRFEPEGESE